MESFLLQFQPNGQVDTQTPSSPNNHIPLSPRSSRQIYLSPMRLKPSLMSPRGKETKYSYSIGQSPAKDLQDINRNINSPIRTKPKSKRHLFHSENGESPKRNKNDESRIKSLALAASQQK